MPDSDGPSGSAGRLLTQYSPRGAAEADDVASICELLRSGEDPWSQSMVLHLTASAVVVHPATNRLLLRWHPHVKAWLQIGGHGDPGESDPLEIALREGVEETGLRDLVPWPDAALVHAVIVPVGARPGKPAHRHADLRFVLATEQPDTAQPENADAPLRWLDVAAATAATREANLRETIHRVAGLLNH